MRIHTHTDALVSSLSLSACLSVFLSLFIARARARTHTHTHTNTNTHTRTYAHGIHSPPPPPSCLIQTDNSSLQPKAGDSRNLKAPHPSTRKHPHSWPKTPLVLGVSRQIEMDHHCMNSHFSAIGRLLHSQHIHTHTVFSMKEAASGATLPVPSTLFQ